MAFSDKLTVTLEGEIWRDTPTLLRDYFNDLGAKLFNLGQDKLYLRDDLRFLRAICSATAFPEYDATRAPGLRAAYSLEFTAEPFWYASTESENIQTAIGSSPFAYPVTNNGKIRTPVRIEITAVGGPKLDVKLTNSTTGLFSRFTGTIAQNTSLIIDGQRNSVQNNSVNALNNFEGTFFPLEPGLNSLTYAGPTSVNVKVTWTERFIN